MMVKLALRMHEDSLCGRCGHSTRLSQSGDAQIAYRGESATCYACIAANLAAESGAGKTAYAVDLRDTPGAMDPDTADDIRWMPSEEEARAMGLTGKASGVNDAERHSAATDGLDRYADSAPTAATASPATSTTTAIVPLSERASEQSSA